MNWQVNVKNTRALSVRFFSHIEIWRKIKINLWMLLLSSITRWEKETEKVTASKFFIIFLQFTTCDSTELQLLANWCQPYSTKAQRPNTFSSDCSIVFKMKNVLMNNAETAFGESYFYLRWLWGVVKLRRGARRSRRRSEESYCYWILFDSWKRLELISSICRMICRWKFLKRWKSNSFVPMLNRIKAVCSRFWRTAI